MVHDTYVQDGKLLFSADLGALNNSGVAGQVTVLVDQKAHSLTVDIQATGLEPDQMHIQHIHGFPDGTDSKSPTIAQDADGDGFVELAEGLPTYGPIQLNLTLDPDSATHDHGTEGHDHSDASVFPTVGADGVLSYNEVFRFDMDDPNAAAVFASLNPLDAKEIVLHGLTTNASQGSGTDGEVDGTAGYKLVLPVASGELVGIAPAADVLAAVDALGLPADEVVDWNAIAAEVTANFEATGRWFL